MNDGTGGETNGSPPSDLDNGLEKEKEMKVRKRGEFVDFPSTYRTTA